MTARPFLPGCVDYDGAMSRNFNAARALSEDALIVWRTALAPYLAGVGPIVDVGSGTGRFTVRMAEWFGRVLKPGGRVLVRGAFSGRLGGITLFDHFPEARDVCEQFPRLEETAETLAAPGFGSSPSRESFSRHAWA